MDEPAKTAPGFLSNLFSTLTGGALTDTVIGTLDRFVTGQIGIKILGVDPNYVYSDPMSKTLGLGNDLLPHLAADVGAAAILGTGNIIHDQYQAEKQAAPETNEPPTLPDSLPSAPEGIQSAPVPPVRSSEPAPAQAPLTRPSEGLPPRRAPAEPAHPQRIIGIEERSAGAFGELDSALGHPPAYKEASPEKGHIEAATSPGRKDPIADSLSQNSRRVEMPQFNAGPSKLIIDGEKLSISPMQMPEHKPPTLNIDGKEMKVTPDEMQVDNSRKRESTRTISSPQKDNIETAAASGKDPLADRRAAILEKAQNEGLHRRDPELYERLKQQVESGDRNYIAGTEKMLGIKAPADKPPLQRGIRSFPDDMERLDRALAGNPGSAVPGAVDGRMALEEYKNHMIIENHPLLGDVAVDMNDGASQVLGGAKADMRAVTSGPAVSEFHEKVQNIQAERNPVIGGREFKGRTTPSMTEGEGGAIVIKRGDQHVLIEPLDDGKMRVTMEDPAGGIRQGTLPMPKEPEQSPQSSNSFEQNKMAVAKPDTPGM